MFILHNYYYVCFPAFLHYVIWRNVCSFIIIYIAGKWLIRWSQRSSYVFVFLLVNTYKLKGKQSFFWGVQKKGNKIYRVKSMFEKN